MRAELVAAAEGLSYDDKAFSAQQQFIDDDLIEQEAAQVPNRDARLALRANKAAKRAKKSNRK